MLTIQYFIKALSPVFYGAVGEHSNFLRFLLGKNGNVVKRNK